MQYSLRFSALSDNNYTALIQYGSMGLNFKVIFLCKFEYGVNRVKNIPYPLLVSILIKIVGQNNVATSLKYSSQ